MTNLERMLRGALVLMMAIALSIASRAAVPVFRDGKVCLPVVIATDASLEERTAADELARGLTLMSGLSWPVLTEESAGKAGFYFRRTHSIWQPARLKVAKDLFTTAKNVVGPDSFRIRSNHGSVYIEGATPEATGFAVAWFLQRYGGVRWYSPGEEGEVVPRRTEWSLPEMDEVHEPAYVSREISGLSTPEAVEWARRNGLRGRLEYSHALEKVFPTEVLAAKPDWCPLLKGQRYKLLSAEDNRWQPNLALQEVSEYAAHTAAVAFAHNPLRPSYSLGINDTVCFDQSAATRALVEPLRYFRGMPDYSPLVFTFMNRAAQSLAKTNPNRYLGCLAYFWCENPPSFPVNSQVVPYVTTDRSQYYDREFRAVDLALMARWGASGTRAFGLWEYAEGETFLVPRMPCRALAEAVREGWLHGARGYMAEVGPRWGFDEFKLWLLAQLMWEPERPFEELADDFFRGYYNAAAKPMRQFFEGCEAQWMGQTGHPYWLKYYKQEDQSLLFPPEVCTELRGMLERAKEAAKGDSAVMRRVARTSRAFALTEAYVAFDAVRRDLTAIVGEGSFPDLPDDALLAALIKQLMERRSELEKKYADEYTSIDNDQLMSFVRNDPVPRLLWLAGRRDSSSPKRILDLAGAWACPAWQQLAEVLAVGELKRWPELAVNGKFEQISGEVQEPRFLYPHSGLLPAGWEVRAMATETGKVLLVESISTAGAKALRIEGGWDTQVFQWRPAKPDYLYVARAQLRGHSSPGNDSALFLTFLSASGKVIGVHRMQSLPKGEIPAWRTAVLADVAPKDAVWVGVGVGSSRQVQDDWFEIGSVSLVCSER